MAKGDAGSCRRCGRVLKSKESLEAGIGPVCAAKEGALVVPKTSETRQVSIYPARSYFTRDEARALLGKTYTNTAPYSGVPAGTVGKVVDVYGSGDALGLDIQWQGLEGGTPHELSLGGLRIDGFSRDDLYCIFGPKHPNAGRRAMSPLDGPDGGPLVDYGVVR